MTSSIDDELEKRLVGKRIGQYMVDEPGKVGAVGVVYKAHIESQPTISRAIKVYIQQISASPDLLKQFNSETENLRRLQESSKGNTLENIVNVYETGFVEGTGTVSDGCAYIVMEYMDSGTLRHPKYTENLDIKEKLQILAEAARGLQCAHDAGVLHLDVHGNNILLHDNGKVVKLGDFGVSHIIDSNVPRVSMSARKPVLYRSPEQDNGRASAATDIFQLGATLYEEMTGTPPNIGYESSSKFIELWPDSLKDLIRLCLNFNEDNMPDAEQLNEELLSIKDFLIRWEEKYEKMVDSIKNDLEAVCHRALKNKCHTLVASDVEALADIYWGGLESLKGAGYEIEDNTYSEIVDILMLKNQQEIDAGVMTEFAKIFGHEKVKVVAQEIADLAATYSEAAAAWREQLGWEMEWR